MNPQKPVTLYTIGHSNRTLAEFIQASQSVAVKTLVDVRAQPQSRRFPQFSQQSLRNSLESAGFVYHWAGRQLGGRREPRGTSKHIGIKDENLRAFADYMETPVFQQAAAQLINLAMRETTAILCAEKLPEHCHRGLMADYLLLQGVEVLHIIDPTTILSHQLSPMARRESLQLIYDRGAKRLLDV